MKPDLNLSDEAATAYFRLWHPDVTPFDMWREAARRAEARERELKARIAELEKRLATSEAAVLNS
ncbi:MAG: hypothetical protein JO025_01955 [Verrucomicrobia bacterium]|jgi:hypothetical protein|nr:hypothetical protein [Verrucomicrobiota bacterium]